MISLEERREWALRQGRPQWIWPEATPDEWHMTMREIARATAAILNGRDARIVSDRADIVGLAGYISGIGPLLGWWIGQGRLGADRQVGALLAQHLTHNRLRQTLLADRLGQLRVAMEARQIAVVVLKGAHTGWCHFPDPATRPMSDIDLLVSPRDRIRAGEVLQAAGYACEGLRERESTWRATGVPAEPSDPTIVRADDPWTIDLHHSLDICAAPGMPHARLDLGEPMATAFRSDHSAGHLHGPLLTLHLAVHAGSGLHSLTLLRVVELVLVIRVEQAMGRLEWRDFMALAEVCHAHGYAWPALALANQLVPGIVPDGVLNACVAAVPARARRVVGRLDPATSQRVGRMSLSEHFMWTHGPAGWLRHLSADLWPGMASSRDIWRMYRARGWMLRRGRVET